MNTFFLPGNGLEHLPAFATSLAVGLLIGIERERSPAAKAGLRTFALTAMLGTLLGLLTDALSSPWILASGILVVGAMILSAYIGDSCDEDPGTTTQAALILCLCLGTIIWYGYNVLAIMLAITTTILLHYKPELESMSKSLSRQDLQSMLQFAVLSLIILPVLPDQNFGPYATFNPYRIWWMVVLISGLNLAGYVALRITGQRFGAPLLGFLGGMISSTATTLAYSRYGKNIAMTHLAVVVITIANLVVLIRLGVLSSVISPTILPHILPVLASGFILGSAGAFYYWKRIKSTSDLPLPEIRNPTEIKTALSFGALYAIVLLAAAWLSDMAGSRGVYLLAAVSGLTDVDAISLSSLHLFEEGKLLANQTILTISIAYLSNVSFKLGLIAFIGGKAMVQRCAIGMGTASVGIIAGILLF